jgi:hypothetical protein
MNTHHGSKQSFSYGDDVFHSCRGAGVFRFGDRYNSIVWFPCCGLKQVYTRSLKPADMSNIIRLPDRTIERNVIRDERLTSNR